MQFDNNVFNFGKLAEYTDLLRSEEFFEYLQRRLKYNIEEIKPQYLNYIEEAAFGIKLISGHDLKGKRILEIGSGVGILSSWMLNNGIDIVGIEPSAIGYAFHYDILSAIWDYFKLPRHCIFDMSAEQLDPRKTGKFDLIFSVNVMEHIPAENLALAISKMDAVLKDDGIMYHHCPNYMVPFEPHYGLPLIPFFPHITGKLKGVYQEGVWQSLNFITVNKVKKIVKHLGLKAEFKKAMMQESFMRLEKDPQFSLRHPMLTRMYYGMKAVGIIDLMKHIPPSLCTPMTVTISRKK